MPDEPDKTGVYFIEEKFALIYPMQRYHYLIHLLPEEFVSQKLQNTVWFELAPGEKPEDLLYPDEQLIEDITPDVLTCLFKTKFFETLDDKFFPKTL